MTHDDCLCCKGIVKQGMHIRFGDSRGERYAIQGMGEWQKKYLTVELNVQKGRLL